MKTNLSLALAGVVLLLIAAQRSGALRINRQFVINNIPLVIALGAVILINVRVGGRDLVLKGLGAAGQMTISFFPMLVLMFLLMGEAMVLVGLYRGELTTFLSGRHGLVGSFFSAIIMPGSLTSLPIIKELWDQGASRGPLLVFLLTSPLIGWQMILLQQPILGWKLTGIKVGLGVIISVLVIAFTALGNLLIRAT